MHGRYSNKLLLSDTSERWTIGQEIKFLKINFVNVMSVVPPWCYRALLGSIGRYRTVIASERGAAHHQ